MQLRGDSPLYFATDLTNFLGCRRLTALERLAAHKLAKRPFFDDPMLEILRERGLAHERARIVVQTETMTLVRMRALPCLRQHLHAEATAAADSHDTLRQRRWIEQPGTVVLGNRGMG